MSDTALLMAQIALEDSFGESSVIAGGHEQTDTPLCASRGIAFEIAELMRALAKGL